MKKAIFFIEGLEHLRFVEPYMKSIINSDYEIEVMSFENLLLDDFKTILINKDEFNKFCLNLNSEYLITTTPGVGNPYFQKSKILPKSKRPKYIYLFHSLVSPNEVYSKKSFIGFDYIFCPNEIIASQLKHLTKKSTKIFSEGYPLLTNQHYFQKKFDSHNQKILIAPSWGKFNLFKDGHMLTDLIENIGTEYEIYLRPHPMEDLDTNTKNNLSNVIFDFEKDLKNLAYFDYLITDWSGIGIEYSILTNRKTLYVNTIKKKRRKLFLAEKNLELVENKIRKSAGVEINFDNLSEIESYLTTDLNIYDDNYINKIKEPRFNTDKFESFFV